MTTIDEHGVGVSTGGVPAVNLAGGAPRTPRSVSGEGPLLQGLHFGAVAAPAVTACHIGHLRPELGEGVVAACLPLPHLLCEPPPEDLHEGGEGVGLPALAAEAAEDAAVQEDLVHTLQLRLHGGDGGVGDGGQGGVQGGDVRLRYSHHKLRVRQQIFKHLRRVVRDQNRDAASDDSTTKPHPP
eukprot:CAMPEP_0198206266 /NCGR_PEP_ID=MMETSP1445-20131203/9796_1 /TAXON_ID=36898 /ORGANISM="Pyramimonas sp., Strain CCMP2087" /LENGTH=183 /DNA_ID=CAMNT_0043878889 /DNA_START=726 /DNA_END=1274 /DNA_ORIENTATION=+